MSLDLNRVIPKGLIESSKNTMLNSKISEKPEAAPVPESLLESTLKVISKSQEDRIYNETVDLSEANAVNKELSRSFRAGKKDNKDQFKAAKEKLQGMDISRPAARAVAARRAGETYTPKSDKLKNKSAIHFLKLKSAARKEFNDATEKHLLENGYTQTHNSGKSAIYTKHDPETNTLFVAKHHFGNTESRKEPTLKITDSSGSTSTWADPVLWSLSGTPDQESNVKKMIANHHKWHDDRRAWDNINEDVNLSERNDDLDNLQYTKVDATKKKAKRFSDMVRERMKSQKKDSQYEETVFEACSDEDEMDFKTANTKKKAKRFADKTRDMNKKSKKDYQYEELEGLSVYHEELGEGVILEIKSDGTAECLFSEEVYVIDQSDLNVQSLDEDFE